jgi:hypothetical protein
MNEVASVLEQLRVFLIQHAPDAVPTGAVSVAVVCLVGGIVLSVLGAKFARFGLTTGFVLLGGLLGASFADGLGFSRTACVPAGALLFGVIGFQTFRLWVGVASAAVLSAIVLSTFGYQRVTPHVAEFQQVSPWVIPDSSVQSISGAASAYVIPTRDQQVAYVVERSPSQWAADFWAFLSEHDATTARNGKALAALTALGGLCVGLLAVRFALIVSTSLIGTVLVTTAAATLLTRSVPESYQAFQNNPMLVGVGVGAFLMTSLVLQAMLMRKAAAGAGATTGKAKS